MNIPGLRLFTPRNDCVLGHVTPLSVILHLFEFLLFYIFYKSMDIPGLRLVALHYDCVLALLGHVTPLSVILYLCEFLLLL